MAHGGGDLFALLSPSELANALRGSGLGMLTGSFGDGRETLRVGSTEYCTEVVRSELLLYGVLFSDWRLSSSGAEPDG